MSKIKPKKYKTAKAVIAHALELIQSRRGWLQGDLNDGQGRYCAIGAIRACSATPEAQRLAEQIVSKGVAEATRGLKYNPDEDDPESTIIEVNDGSHHRSAASAHDAVVRGFKKALA